MQGQPSIQRIKVVKKGKMVLGKLVQLVCEAELLFCPLSRISFIRQSWVQIFMSHPFVLV